MLWILCLFVLLLAAVIAVAGSIVRGRQITNAEAALASAVKRTEAQESAPDKDTTEQTRLEKILQSLANLGQRLEGSRLHKALITDEDRMLLDQSGWGGKRGESIFLGVRISLAIFLPLSLLVTFNLQGIKVFVVPLCAAAAGILLPKMALRSWNKRVIKAIDDELPLFIDLLRLLQGVGFSVDQSLQMLGDKLRPTLPVIGRELAAANMVYSRGRSREQSLERLATAFHNDDMNSLIKMVVQVHNHGGAVQEPLKQFANRIREKRMMSMKEKVGRLSVKMTVVMMVTLLPALMLVLSGPAIVSLAQVVSRMGEV